MAITAENLVQREVHYCVSALIANTAALYGEKTPTLELADMAEQAFELCTPLEDWETPATDNGWHGDDEDSARQFCEDNDIEPYQREIFEHWIVSDWLADKLAAKGEKVDKDFAGLTVWARTTTGQGIANDWVIEQIAADVNAA